MYDLRNEVHWNYYLVFQAYNDTFLHNFLHKTFCKNFMILFFQYSFSMIILKSFLGYGLKSLFLPTVSEAGTI